MHTWSAARLEARCRSVMSAMTLPEAMSKAA